MYLLHGISLDDLKDMGWAELTAWQDDAIDLYRKTHGLSDE